MSIGNKSNNPMILSRNNDNSSYEKRGYKTHGRYNINQKEDKHKCKSKELYIFINVILVAGNQLLFISIDLKYFYLRPQTLRIQ